MIVIYGIHMQNDNISRYYFQFIKLLIFWVVREGVKGHEMAQNDKKLLHLEDDNNMRTSKRIFF